VGPAGRNGERRPTVRVNSEVHPVDVPASGAVVGRS